MTLVKVIAASSQTFHTSLVVGTGSVIPSHPTPVCCPVPNSDRQNLHIPMGISNMPEEGVSAKNTYNPWAIFPGNIWMAKGQTNGEALSRSTHRQVSEFHPCTGRVPWDLSIHRLGKGPLSELRLRVVLKFNSVSNHSWQSGTVVLLSNYGTKCMNRILQSWIEMTGNLGLVALLQLCPLGKYNKGL